MYYIFINKFKYKNKYIFFKKCKKINKKRATLKNKSKFRI